MNPETLSDALLRLATNYRWTWTPSARRIFERLPTHADAKHPVVVVGELSSSELEHLASDAEFADAVQDEVDDLEHTLADSAPSRIAYLSPEFGLSETLPQYAGGLGILAGDHLKTSSDLDAGIVGVGLFYSQGVFRQVMADGWQTETYHDLDPRSVGASDTGVKVSVPFPGRDVTARVWRIDVGRTPLLLLDTAVDSNDEADRLITDRLYDGDEAHRAAQEMVLGVGGALALEALDYSIDVHHLNEGHAGFIALALVDRLITDGDLDGAVEAIREKLVFTTHTPVPAGIDRFHRSIIEPYLSRWAERWSIEIEAAWRLGEDPDDHSMFNMAALCLRMSARANGVSRMHGEVSRGLFSGVGIGDDIGHVTNGVHARTWTGDHFQHLFDERLGGGWDLGDIEAWDRVDAIDDESLFVARRQSSEVLSAVAAERAGAKIDPEALIFGFARRFAPYKRATLLLRRPDLLHALVGDDSKPVHFVFAGKAHPANEGGKRLISDLIEASSSPEVRNRITFIPDYDMAVGHAMVQGSDVWLNNPIRPHEASGTSGEKAVLNGVLNCSIPDGWWAEMFDGTNGWNIDPSGQTDPDARDQEEATAMLQAIAEIANEYHAARPVFYGRIRHAWRTLGPQVVAARMLRDYQATVYRTADST